MGEKEHSREREHSKDRNKSRRRNYSEEEKAHSQRGGEYSEESKLDRSPRKSPRGDRLSRIEADLKRGALSEWDLKRATGGFEAKKWSWQKKKEDEMKAFLKYENLCNREKKSIAAKFAERDQLWLEEREKEREEKRKDREKAPRERTHSGEEKSRRGRTYTREEKSKLGEGSSKHREDKAKVEKEERTVRRTDDEARGEKREEGERNSSKRER